MSMKKYRVPKHAITEKGLRRLIRDATKKDSQAAWAHSKGITPQVVSAFMRKVQGAGLQLPEVLGYKPQIVFIPLDAEEISTANPPRRPTNKPSKKVDHSRPPLEKKDYKPGSSRREARDRLKKRNKG